MGCSSSRNINVVQTENELDVSNTPHTNSNEWPLSPTAQLIDISSLARRYSRNSGDSADAEAEIRQLQTDLETLERLFQSLLGQSFTAQLVRNIEVQHNINLEEYPPASNHEIRNLSCIQIADQDLQDECNRECCICFRSHQVNDTVVRLPCGHLFHQPCIKEWLEKKCTCPICRYEIPTDNALFEMHRLERMRGRRIRLREHELNRLSLNELDSLMERVVSDDDNDGNGTDGGGLAVSSSQVRQSHTSQNRNSSNSGSSIDRDSLIRIIRRASNVDIVVEEGCALIQTEASQSDRDDRNPNMDETLRSPDDKNIQGTVPQSPLYPVDDEDSTSA